jgi:hypothetical protein
MDISGVIVADKLADKHPLLWSFSNSVSKLVLPFPS